MTSKSTFEINCTLACVHKKYWPDFDLRLSCSIWNEISRNGQIYSYYNFGLIFSSHKDFANCTCKFWYNPQKYYNLQRSSFKIWHFSSLTLKFSMGSLFKKMTENICDTNNKQFLAKVYWMDDHKPRLYCMDFSTAFLRYNVGFGFWTLFPFLQVKKSALWKIFSKRILKKNSTLIGYFRVINI